MHITVNGLDYYVEDEGQGEPLLLLHGFTGSVRSWDEVASRLSADYRILRVDLPGHGRTAFASALDRYSMAATTRDLATILTERRAAPAHVLGYSMGGRLAFGFGLAYPAQVRSLIIESGSPGLATEAERTARRASDEALASQIEREGIQAFVTMWERLPLWQSQACLPLDIRRKQREIRIGNNSEGLAYSLRSLGTGAQPSLWTALATIHIPTLLITGALDPRFTTIAYQMRAQIGEAILNIIPDAGHTTHLEQPDPFITSVKQFLQHTQTVTPTANPTVLPPQSPSQPPQVSRPK